MAVKSEWRQCCDFCYRPIVRQPVIGGRKKLAVRIDCTGEPIEVIRKGIYCSKKHWRRSIEYRIQYHAKLLIREREHHEHEALLSRGEARLRRQALQIRLVLVLVSFGEAKDSA